MKRTSVLMVMSFLLMACSSETQLPDPALQFQTATPIPAATSFNAIVDFPNDKFLFVVVDGGVVCSEECNCPVIEPIMDPFRFEDGTLYLLAINLDFQEAWAKTRMNNYAVGFYVYRSAIRADYAFIASFPYKTPDSNFVINAVSEQGYISVKTASGNITLQPGQHLNSNTVEKRSDSCEMTYSTRITNHGFVEDKRVSIIPEGQSYP